MAHIFNTYFDKIFVLNLDEASERLKNITKHLESEGIEFEKITAWNKKMCSDFYYQKTGKKIEPTPIMGCSYSHYKAVQEGLNRGYEKILVLEDDACIIDKNYKITFANAIKTLPDDWSYFKLGYNLTHQMMSREDFVFEKISDNILHINATSFANADAFNLKNIRKSEVLMKMFADEKTMIKHGSKHVDHRYYIMCKENNIKQYNIYPMIFSQANGFSYIENVDRKMNSIESRTINLVNSLLDQQKKII